MHKIRAIQLMAYGKPARYLSLMDGKIIFLSKAGNFCVYTPEHGVVPFDILFVASEATWEEYTGPIPQIVKDIMVQPDTKLNLEEVYDILVSLSSTGAIFIYNKLAIKNPLIELDLAKGTLTLNDIGIHCFEGYYLNEDFYLFEWYKG